MNLNSKVVVPEHVLFRELDGEAVLLNLDDEAYYGLDPVGTRMWLVLGATESIAAAHAQLLNEYDVDEERLRNDLIALIEELDQRGLVFIGDSQ